MPSREDTMAFTVNKLSDTGAAEVLGLDCSAPIEAVPLAALRRTLLDFPVVAIRNQALTATQQAAFSRQLGPLESQDRKTYCHPDDPDILILSNEIRPDGTAVGIVDAGDFWHSDSSHLAEPCRATILYAVRNPKTGGDTEFCNMYQVYEALPDDLRRRVEGRDGIHHISKSKNPRVTISAARTDAAAYYKEREKATADMRQPMVRTHPETGKKALFLGRRINAYVIGLPVAESEVLLDCLWAHTVQAKFTWRQEWQVGDLIWWDNRCAMHRRDAFDPRSRRLMHRTQLKGTRPV
jgi:taurine dioxygenase